MSYELKTLYGLPVFTPAFTDPHGKLPAPDTVAWRIEEPPFGEDRPFTEEWGHFLDRVDTERVTALVIGSWGDYSEVTDGGFEEALTLLIEAKDRFPALRALFLADVDWEVQHSWVSTGDVTPVLEAFPSLEEFGVRGCGYSSVPLELRPVRHERLRSLRFESGGLPASVVRAVIGSELPALESLDLWLGVPDYGGDTELGDLAPILAGTPFPGLRRLGLRNSEFQDEIAAAVAHSPVVPRLHTLDLSLGTLTDTGAEALLTGQPLTHLKRLDLHHHFLSNAMMRRIRDTLEPAGVEVDLSDQQEADVFGDEVWRYVAVSE